MEVEAVAVQGNQCFEKYSIYFLPKKAILEIVPLIQCDQIGQFFGLGQLFKAFGDN